MNTTLITILVVFAAANIFLGWWAHGAGTVGKLRRRARQIRVLAAAAEKPETRRSLASDADHLDAAAALLKLHRWH